MKHRPKRIRALSPIQQRARELRQEMTPAEKILWQHLRNRQLAGLKFRRQHPLDRFIVDFYCAAARLIVEIDGPIHDFQPERDSARTAELAQKGYRLIRFQNEQVLNDLKTVLAAIQAAASHPPLSQPSERRPKGEGSLPSPDVGRGVGGEGHHLPLSQTSQSRPEGEGHHPPLSQPSAKRPGGEPKVEAHLPLSQPSAKRPEGEGHHPPLSQPSAGKPEAEAHLPLSRQRERGPGGEGL